MVVVAGEIARRTWVRDRWCCGWSGVLCACSSSCGIEAMGTLTSLALLADFGAGCTTKNLAGTGDDDRRICVFSRVWHCMVQVVDN